MNFRSLVGAVLFALAGWLSAAGAQEKVDPKEPEKGEKPKEIDKDTIEAWEKAKFKAGWVREFVPGELRVFGSRLPKTDGRVPGFAGPNDKINFAGLPAVEVPFALTFRASAWVSDAVLKDIGAMKNLVHLDLAACGITDERVALISGLPKLTHLDLMATRITDVGMKEVGKLKTLTVVWLGSRNITDAGVKELVGLENLTTLHLIEVAITDAAIKDIVGFKKLTLLRVPGPVLTNKSLGVLREADKLHVLFDARAEKNKRPAKVEDVVAFTLKSTRVGDAGLKELVVFKNLTTLIVSGNDEMTGAGLEHLAEFKNLTTLHLHECRSLTDADLKHLAALPNLKTLTLDHLPITAAGLKHLGGCQTLTTLDLGNTLQKLLAAQRNEVLRELRQKLPNCKIKG